MRFRDLSRQKFGRLTVLEATRNKFNRCAWRCRCICGNITIVLAGDLHSGHARSCGCIYAKHKMSYTAEYRAWVAMIQRCHNPKNPGYNSYGGRKIFVCARWKDSFEAFLKDIGRRPSSQYSLDRIDNEKGYFKENCHWATATQQARNRRDNRILKLGGRSLTVAEWAEVTGIPHYAICHRLTRGLSVAKALTKPSRQ